MPDDLRLIVVKAVEEILQDPFADPELTKWAAELALGKLSTADLAGRVASAVPADWPQKGDQVLLRLVEVAGNSHFVEFMSLQRFDRKYGQRGDSKRVKEATVVGVCRSPFPFIQGGELMVTVLVSKKEFKDKLGYDPPGTPYGGSNWSARSPGKQVCFFNEIRRPEAAE